MTAATALEISPAVADPSAVSGGTGAARRPRLARRQSASTRLRAGTLTLLLAGLLILGFVGYLFGLTGLSEARAQHTMFKTFQRTLGQAVAPVGPAPTGTPVAVIDIPALGLHNVVIVEGTDARTLTHGPGHRRDTPLPGQAGVSVLYGRRALFGAPFAGLTALRVGDRITVCTGQGAATYAVASFGSGAQPATATSTNRLVLTTADSAFLPSSTVSVSADLRTGLQPLPGGLPAIADDEHGMRGAIDESVGPLMLWGQVLLALAVLGTLAARRWAIWPTYLCLAPTTLAVLWNVYENAAGMLPNLF